MEGLNDSHNELIMDRKKVSVVMALIVLSGMFIFIAGYFWGYRQATIGLQVGIGRQAFSDQATHTMDSMTELGSEIPEGSSSTEQRQEAVSLAPIIEPAVSIELVETVPDSAAASESSASKMLYYAELIGFGNASKAQSWVDKVKQRGYPVVLLKRVGKSGKGKKITWYQVVTENFTDRDQLIKLTDSIKRTEKLQSIKIKSV